MIDSGESNMKRRKEYSLLCIVCLYIAVYSCLFYFRRPAANLAYWAYTENTSETVETCLYYGFFPVYYVHQRVFNVQKHTWDRSEPVYPPGFNG
jgi:hypothetical protein